MKEEVEFCKYIDDWLVINWYCRTSNEMSIDSEDSISNDSVTDDNLIFDDDFEI